MLVVVFTILVTCKLRQLTVLHELKLFTEILFAIVGIILGKGTPLVDKATTLGAVRGGHSRRIAVSAFSLGGIVLSNEYKYTNVYKLLTPRPALT